MSATERSRTRLTWLIGLLSASVMSVEANGGELVRPSGNPKQPSSLTVSCAPETPVVHPGDSIEVRAWVTDASGKALVQPPRYTWVASAGRISGGEVARWVLDNSLGDAKGDLRASARVTVQHTRLGQGECEVQVFVAKRPGIGKPRTTRSLRLSSGSALLLPTERPPSGYGLYSYLLFDTPPKNDVERERYLKALEAYLLVLAPIKELEQYLPRSELNLILIPVRRNIALPDVLSSPKETAQAAEAVLSAYDYARADAFLARLRKPTLRSGPFLVAMAPSTADTTAASLLFDMSHVSPALAWDWVRAFCMLATQERSRGKAGLAKLALHTRNAIAVAARELAPVTEALPGWIQMIKIP
jgi:hypothetical protein